MDLSEYFNALRRHWALIIVMGVIGAGVAFVIAQATPPQYRATASVFVSAQSGNTTSELVQGSTYTQNLIQSYAQLAVLPSVLQPVIDELELETTPRALAEMITAENPINTVIIEITATAGSAEQSADIANAVSRELSASARSLAPDRADGTAAVEMTQIAEASAPRIQSIPNTRFLLFTGLAAGLAIGIAWALVREVLDTRVRSEDDLRRISDLPILGAVPVNPRHMMSQIVMRAAPSSPGSEAFRRVATNLGFINPGVPLTSVVVASALPHEGKSTVALNLALALAETKERVLLVDADLRRPSIAEYCQIDGSIGLTSVLTGHADVDSAIIRWGSIHVLPGGPLAPNPNQLVASNVMSHLVEQLTSRYDVVVFDAAPLLPVTDTLALTRLTDGALLVARNGHTKRAHIRASVESLETVGATILGLVVNQARQDREAAHYGYGAGQSPARRSVTRQSDPQRREVSPVADHGTASHRA